MRFIVRDSFDKKDIPYSHVGCLFPTFSYLYANPHMRVFQEMHACESLYFRNRPLSSLECEEIVLGESSSMRLCL